MSKINSILSILLFFVFISVCLSISQVQTDVKVDNKQKSIDTSIFGLPKISAYNVLEKWNYTSDNEVSVVAVSADGNYMAVGVTYVTAKGGDPSHEIFFFNTSDHDGIPMWSFGVSIPINSIAISADGKYIAVTCWIEAYLFNSSVPEPSEEKEPIWMVNWGDTINSVDISADGKYIVLGGLDSGSGLIILYNNSYASTGYDKTDDYIWYCNPDYEVLSVAISADGNYVAVGTDNPLDKIPQSEHSVFLLDSREEIDEDGFLMPIWSYNAMVPIDSIAISADGKYIIAGTSEDVGMCFLLNNTVPDIEDNKEEIWFLDYGSDMITSVDISADGKYIVVGWKCPDVAGDYGFVDLYNNSYPSMDYDKSGEYLWYGYTVGPVNSVSISADGQYIAAGTEIEITKDISYSDTVFLYNNTDYICGEEHLPTWTFNTEYNVNSVSMSAWGNYIAAGGEYGETGRTFLFYHARPLPIISNGNGDDDDDDNKEEAIPFGNYYLLFVAIALASLIIITKRKTIFHNK